MDDDCGFWSVYYRHIHAECDFLAERKFDFDFSMIAHPLITSAYETCNYFLIFLKRRAQRVLTGENGLLNNILVRIEGTRADGDTPISFSVIKSTLLARYGVDGSGGLLKCVVI